MKLDSVRGDFPILQTQSHGKPLVYLDNAATMQMPQAVLDVIGQHYITANGNVHRGVHGLSQKSTDHMEKARETVAGFLGSAQNEVIFTSGTTESINLLSRMLEPEIHPGQQILVSAMEHHSNLIPWQELCKRTGAALNVIPLCPNGDLDLQELEKLLARETALVAVCLVSNVLGTVNPVKEIARLCHKAGARLAVDGAQGMKLGKMNVKDLDCDFLAFSGHKLGALTGIGVLYGKEQHLERLRPVSYGGGMVHTVRYEGAEYGQVPARFEAGIPNYVGAISLGAALEYLRALGLRQISAQEEGLTEQLAAGLAQMQGITLWGHPQHRSGCVSFTVEGVHPFDMGVLLDSLGFADRTGHMCAQPLVESLGVSSVIRVSPAFYNSPEEIEAFLSAVEKIIPMLRG